MNEMYLPLAISIPELRAEERPSFCLWITVTLESFFANLSHIKPHLSGEPSSTRITSIFE